MANTPFPVYSAAEIAAALGQTARGVRKALDGILPAGGKTVRGRWAGGWTFSQLPQEWRAALEETARRRQYRNAEHLLSDPPQAWQPKIEGGTVSLGQIAEHCVREAAKLQRALLSSLRRLTGEHPAAAAEAEAKGLAEYRSEFGHAISARHWRALADRTLERDGGAEAFDRVELFLSDKLARRVETPADYEATMKGLDHLSRALSMVKDRNAPSKTEAEYVFVAALDELQFKREKGENVKAAKRTILDALAASGVKLAKSAEGLEKSFSRKWERFLQGGCKASAIRDGRTIEAGVCRKLELPEEDRLNLIAMATELGGNIPLAWRRALEQDRLSPETTQRYIRNPANKSYVPRSVLDSVRFDVALLEDIHHGPRQARLNGPWIPRDYSDCHPGDWGQLDDLTAPIYFAEETPDGIQGMRGQVILQVDVATGLVQGFALHSQNVYNAKIIRSVITRVHDEWGLPKKGLYLENGLWRKARLLKGRQSDEVPLEEMELGLREYMRFIHAKLPRAKIIENIFGILQNEMELLPGYCGRSEMTEKFERLNKQLRQAAAGKLDYRSFLLGKGKWTEILTEICERYNSEPQGGRLKGRSPREAYEQDFDYGDPVTRLSHASRYLLANHRRRERVTKNGIRLVFGGEPYYYRNAETGRLIGRDVLVWHDVEEFPQSITVTDLRRQNAVEVARVEPVPSMTGAGGEKHAAAVRSAEAHMAHARTLYRVIQPRFARNMFRSEMVDRATLELGQTIDAGREQQKAEQQRKGRVAQQVKARERELGISLPKQSRNPERKLRGLDLIREADRLEQQQLSEEQDTL